MSLKPSDSLNNMSTSNVNSNPTNTTKNNKIKDMLIRVGAVFSMLIILTGGSILSAVTVFSAPTILLAVGIPLFIIGLAILFLCIRNGLIPIFMDCIINFKMPSFKMFSSSASSSPSSSLESLADQPILNPKQQIDYIKNNLSFLINGSSYDARVKIDYEDAYIVTFHFKNDSERLYKLSKYTRNSHAADSSSQVKDLYLSSLKLKEICATHSFDKINIPNMQYMELPFPEEKGNYVYDLITEQQLFNPEIELHDQQLEQQNIHLTKSTEISEPLKQLTNLLCTIGCYINPENFLFKPDSLDKVYLSNIIIPNLNQVDRTPYITPSLIGNTYSKGLIKSIYSDPCLKTVLNSIESNNIQIDPLVIQDKVANLKLQEEIRAIYQNPPKLTKTFDFTNQDNITKLVHNAGNDFPVSQNVIDWLMQHIPAINDPFHPCPSNITYQYVRNMGATIDFASPDHPELMFTMYSKSSSHKDHHRESSDKYIKRIYERSILSKIVIEKEKLDSIEREQVSLLNLMINGEEYIVLVTKPFPKSDLLQNKPRFCNYAKIVNSKNNYLKALKQLVLFTAKTKFNISVKNIFLLNQKGISTDYPIGLKTDLLYQRTDPDIFHADNDLFIFSAGSEETMDHVILEAAKLGILSEDPSHLKLTTYNDFKPYLQILKFYEDKNAQDGLLKVTPEELSDYLDLSLKTFISEEIGNRDNKQEVSISMRNAVKDIVDELNLLLQERLNDDVVTNAEGILSKRSVFIDTKNKVFNKYSHIYNAPSQTMKDTTVQTQKISLLDQILQALTAKNLILSPNLTWNSNGIHICL